MLPTQLVPFVWESLGPVEGRSLISTAATKISEIQIAKFKDKMARINNPGSSWARISLLSIFAGT